MKLYPRTLSVLSVTLLGLLAAACSSKSTDDGGEVGGSGPVGTSSGGKASASTTGGKPATNTSVTDTGGSSNIVNLPKACPGLPVTTAAAGGSSTNIDAGAQCAGIGVELEPSPLDIYVMMDRTSSMTYTMGSGAAITRWDVLQSGVQRFVTDPNVLAKAPRVGLQFFGATGDPNDARECDPLSYATPLIEIEDLKTSGQKILTAVEQEALGGQTPWFPSLQGALMHAQDWQFANPNRMTVVVLVTDGYPTECETDISLIQEMVGEYYTGVSGKYNTRGKPGIRTYIIGVAVDKFNLNAVAQAGGTGQATIVDSAGGVNAFVSAMVNITNANISCDLKLPEAPAGSVLDPNAVQVVYTPFSGGPQEIPKADTGGGCGSANGGWYFDNAAKPTKISLCPCSCANLGAGGLEIRFGCRPQFVIN